MFHPDKKQQNGAPREDSVLRFTIITKWDTAYFAEESRPA